MKRIPHKLLTGFFLLLFLARPAPAAQAADVAPELTIEDALRMLEASPRWAAERAQLGLAEAEVIQAGLIANPSLGYNVLQLAQGANTGAATTHQLVLEQQLPLFGQRAKRIEAARAAQRALRAELAARFAERARELHHTFVELLGAQERLRLLSESLQDIKRAEAIVHGRAAAGDRSQYDVLRTSLEVHALDSEMATADAERLEAAGRLGQLLGKPGWQPRARGDLTPIDPAQTAGHLWEHAQRHHPAIAAAQGRLDQTQAAIAQVRRERLPEVALQAGLLATQAENSLAILGGFATPLPLWNRQQGALARARVAQAIAAQEQRAVLAETEAALERSIAVSRSRHAAAARIAAEVFARLPELRRMAEETYRQGQGKTGIVDLLDALRGLKSLRMQYAEQIIGAERAEVDLLYAAGLTGTGAR